MKADKAIIIGGKLYRRGEELPVKEEQSEPEPEPEPELEREELPPLKGKKK